MQILFENKSMVAPKLSIILLDWSCRESFHMLDYLNDQTILREQYEIIWIEYYSRRADDIEKKLKEKKISGKPPVIDRWIVLEMPENVYYHKHLMYNAGILAARGEILCFCDSDVMVKPSFVSHILETFEKDKNIVLHLDEVRNTSERFYPFNNPSFEEVTGDGCINFRQGKTTGLLDTEDILHARNYGACMCARKEDLISIGGADEHTDYLGHICGPYEMTFRLVNDGKKEVWHQEEFLYHTGHPGTNGRNNYLGPHDGSNMSTAALNILDSGRKMPLTENKAIRMLRTQTKDLSKDPLETWIVLGPEIQTWKMNPWRLLASEHRTFWVRVRRKMRKLIQRNNTQSGVSRLSLAVATQLYTRIFWMSFKQLFYKTTSYGANKVMSKSMFFQIEQIFIYFGRIWKNNLYAVEICRKGIDQTIRDGVKEVVLNGANHVSGVLCLLAKETPLKVTGIYDAAMAGKNFLGFKVCPAEDLKGYEGKVMIASLSRISDKANHLQGLGIQKQHIVEFR